MQRKKFYSWFAPGLVVVIYLSSLSFPVLAQNSPRAGLIHFWSPELTVGQRQQLLNQVAREFQGKTRLTLNRDKNASATLNDQLKAEEQSLAAITEAKAKLEAGKKAYLNLKFEEARVELQSARNLLLRNLHQLEDNRPLLEGHLYLGMVMVATDREALAIEEFRKVAFLDPELELSTKEYAPETVAAFAKAKSGIDREVQGNVMLHSTPDKAELFINAKSFGQTPINLNLPIGEYFFRLHKIGWRDWYQVYKVNEGFQKISKTLVSAQEDLQDATLLYRTVSRRNPPDKELMETLTEKAQSMQADLLLLGEVRKEEGNLLCIGQWFDARTQEFSSPVAIRGRDAFPSLTTRLPILVKNLLGQIQGNGYMVADKQLTPRLAPVVPNLQLQPQDPNAVSQPFAKNAGVPPALEKRAWYQKWWVWSLIGAGALGVGATAYLAQQGGNAVLVVDNSGNIPSAP